MERHRVSYQRCKYLFLPPYTSRLPNIAIWSPDWSVLDPCGRATIDSRSVRPLGRMGLGVVRWLPVASCRCALGGSENGKPLIRSRTGAPPSQLKREGG